MSMDCLFCNIANKSIPANIVYEDDATVAFLDIHPRSEGHTVIVPKRHAENILDADDADVSATFLTTKRVAGILNNTLHPAGFTIGVNHGEASGQAVPHFHAHVIPRYAGDGGGSVHSVVNFPPKESLEDILKKIKSM